MLHILLCLLTLTVLLSLKIGRILVAGCVAIVFVSLISMDQSGRKEAAVRTAWEQTHPLAPGQTLSDAEFECWGAAEKRPDGSPDPCWIKFPPHK